MQNMMDLMDIAFPHLGIYLRNVPKNFTIFGFTIALYGVIIAASMLLGIVMAAHMGKKTGQNPDDYWDLSLWIIISAIVGARIYYVIFFWDSYKNNLLEIFNRQRLKLNTNRESSLQLRNQIRRFYSAECTRRNEQNMIRPDRTVTSLHYRAFNNRK